MTKKERKAAKRAKKISEMTKVVSVADIDLVSKVLHPTTADIDDLDIERQLVEDPDIKLNRFFHKGTSNMREVRKEIISKDRRGSKAELHVEVEEMDGLLQLLNVSPLTSASRAEEKARMLELRKKIEEDLIHVQKEQELMMMRKAGFWRWASKKAYKRLLLNGRIWSDKSDDGSPVAKTEDASTSSSASAGVDADADTDGMATEADTGITTPDEDDVTAMISAAKMTSVTPLKDEKLITKADDGWTVIGTPSKIKKPLGRLKLAHNGGLGKLAPSPSPSRRGFYSGVFGYDNEV